MLTFLNIGGVILKASKICGSETLSMSKDEILFNNWHWLFWISDVVGERLKFWTSLSDYEEIFVTEYISYNESLSILWGNTGKIGDGIVLTFVCLLP